MWPCIIRGYLLVRSLRDEISRMAKLFLDPKAPAVACFLIDYSTGGACQQLAKFVARPDRFEVL